LTSNHQIRLTQICGFFCGNYQRFNYTFAIIKFYKRHKHRIKQQFSVAKNTKKTPFLFIYVFGAPIKRVEMASKEDVIEKHDAPERRM
jgi:hypothetical protein